MTPQDSFKKIVGALAILSIPFAYANFVLTGVAGRSEADLYYFFKIGEEAGHLMKWSWLADMLGYYLLLVPLVFLMHYWLKDKNPYWMGILTFSGLTYILVGSVGAAILAKTWPTLISGYANNQGNTQETYRIVFTDTTEMVYGGIWGYLEFLLAGLWWIGVGFMLKSERKVLGIATIALGLFTLVAAVGEVFTMQYVALIGFLVYLLLAPIWAGWVGISILRGNDIKLAKP